MPLLPLIGHTRLRERLDEQVRRGTLAASILLEGPPGVGKQRLALWLAQRLLCEEAGSPCGACRHCRYALDGTHPDIHWVFPREGMKDKDPTPDEVAASYGELIAERLGNGGFYAKPDGSYGIFLAVTRMLVHQASRTPALARRRVFVVGDADRMVPQASSPEAANAFLKLLEEPPAGATLILTTSEPGALLPTIRSRTVAMRVRRLSDAEVREFLALPGAAAALSAGEADELVALARGAPGALSDAASRSQAMTRARALLQVALRDRDRLYRVIYAQGSTKARGPFSDTLEAMTELLHERSRSAAESGDASAAAAHARAVVFVEEARRDAERNAVPQLIAHRLLTRLAETL